MCKEKGEGYLDDNLSTLFPMFLDRRKKSMKTEIVLPFDFLIN